MIKKVLTVLSIILLITVLYLAYFKYIKKLDYIKIFNYDVIFYTSKAMEPRINKGDAVVIKESPNYEKGDIIAYEAYEITNIREIEEITEEEAIVRERYTGGDTTIKNYQIMGKMENRIPKLGDILFFLTKDMTLIFIGFLATAYLFATVQKG